MLVEMLNKMKKIRLLKHQGFPLWHVLCSFTLLLVPMHYTSAQQDSTPSATPSIATTPPNSTATGTATEQTQADPTHLIPSTVLTAAQTGTIKLIPLPSPEPAPTPLHQPSLVAQSSISGADTTWLMVSTALVLLMTLPGIALFYGGMVRKKNVLSTISMVMATAAVVSVLWFVAGYSLAFTPGWGWLGGGSRLWMQGFETVKASAQVSVSHLAPLMPESVFAMFQLSFAVITAALIVGAVVERMRFMAWLIFIALWTLLVYAPVAHWVWEPGGWLARWGALDFAGGTVVHVNAGAAALACAYALGRRRGFGRQAFEPFNLALTMAGTGLLWVGWFGFNAGSALAADSRAGLAMLVTHLAAAAGALSWMGSEYLIRRRMSLLGICSGAVSGLVAVTPAAGYITASSGLLIGLVAGVLCYWGATGLKHWLRADDPLDVFGVHGIGGITGALMTGWLADPVVSGATGSFIVQAAACLAVFAYSFLASMLILMLISMFMKIRVDEPQEEQGLDLSQHMEKIGT
jgi:ammonium transporter, Amt family